MDINNRSKINRKYSVNSLLLFLLSLLLIAPSGAFGDDDLQCRDADKSKGERKIVRNFEEWNEHCSGPRDVRIPLSSGRNHQIVPDSIKIIDRACGTKSKFEGIREQYPEGFVIAFHLENNGTCIREPITGEVLIKDGRGHCRAKVCWIEAKEEHE